MRLKLVSRKDTLLGHVDVPDHWGEYLQKRGAVQNYVLPRLIPLAWDGKTLSAPVDVQSITLAVANFSEHRDAVSLVEGTIEQLEAMPECSFTPSMAYLRSHFTKEE